MSAAETEATFTEEWTYLGKRLDKKDALRQAWRTPAGDLLLTKPLSVAAIGAVVRVTKTSPTQFFTGGENGPKFLRHGGLSEDDALSAAARERAATDEYNRTNMLKRAAKKNSPIEEEIERLRLKTYWMTPAERKAFVMALVQGLL